MIQQSISGYTHKRSENKVSKRYLYTRVHSRINHNSQKVEATQVSTNGWMYKQNVVDTINRILFTLEKEGGSDIYHNIDDPWGHYIKWTKPSHKRTNNVWFQLYEVTRLVKFRDIKKNGGCQGLGVQEEEWKIVKVNKEIQFCKIKRVLKIGCTMMWRHLTLLNHPFRNS